MREQGRGEAWGPRRQSGRHQSPSLPSSLLEMMLESALTDIKEAPPGVLASLTQQVLWLLRLLQDFLCAEGHGNQELWSEKVWKLGAGALCSHAPRAPGLQSG